jgi:hypothetical protein
MSFTTNIAGNAPANTFVYTTTTVSVDNISCENLSATNASISVLTTDLFNPVNVNATNIDCTTITVLDDGNFSEIYTSYIHTSNMSLDGTLGGHTGNFVTINADNAAVDALYINEQSVVLTDKSLIKRDANQVMFIGKNVSTDVTGADFLFRTGTESDVAKLTISRASNVVSAISLYATTTMESDTGIFNSANISDLTVADTTTLGELEVLTSASINNLNVIGANGLTATKGTITNLSSTRATLTNASIVNLSISGDFNASGTSRFYNLTAEYFQSYITGVFQDMDAVTGNITTFESNNISNNILIKTINLSAVNTSISNISSTNITATNITASSTISAPTLTATTTFSAPGGSINNFTTNDIVINDLVTAGSAEFQRGNDILYIYGDSTSSADITIEPSISRVTMTNISATKITGDVSQNLSAGFGIALTTVGGVTTIANTGGSVTDPLNLSTLNASTINVSLLNAPNIEGFTQSTEYGFKSTCDYEEIPISTIVTIPNNTTVPFNEHSAVGVSPMGAYCIPDVTAYNKGLATYTIPVSGYYLFGWRIFVLSSPTSTPHLRFTINNAIGVQVGEYASNNESCTFQGYFVAGDTIKVANGGAGSIQLDLARTRSYWYGHKLTPANNLITSTTNLSIQNLSVSNEMTALDVKSTTGTITTFGSTTGTITTLNSTTVNASKLNASNISVNGEIDFGTAITGPLVAVNEIIASQCSFFGLRVNSSASIAVLNASTINASNISAINISANDITALDVKSTTGAITTFNASTINVSNISAINISANQITAPEIRGTTIMSSPILAGDEVLTNTGLITTLGSTTINASNINASNISAINISATFMTFDTLTPSEKCITAVGEIDAVKFNASVVHISNDLTLDPGGSMRVQSLVPGNDFFIYSNSGNMYLQANGTGNLNIGRNSLPDDISISPAGVITVDNLTSTNAITTTNASITNISSTDLTIATSLTGAGNINITGDVTAGIVSATTLTGDIAGNLTAGDGISLATALGITTIAVSQPYLSLSRTTNYTPGTATFYYVSYNTQLDDGGGTYSYSSGAITVNATGRYVISGSGNIDLVTQTDRVALRIRLTVNTVYSSSYPQAYGYARHQNYIPEATACYTDFVIYLTAGDVVRNRLDISKGNTTGFNSNFDGINIGAGCNCMIRRIS